MPTTIKKKKKKFETRLKAFVGLNYPADSRTLEKLVACGGRRNIPSDELDSLNFNHVDPGEFCDDHPKGSQLDFLLKSGQVQKVRIEIDSSETGR